MKTEIVNIGDELLIGQVINSNASWMAEKLNRAGFTVNQVTVIGDNESQIMNMLEESSGRSDIIIITGGLGPTKDDITKNTFCKYFDTRLVFNEQAFADIEELFRSRGFNMTATNRAQAELPENCIALRNRNGTAPGMWFEHKKDDRKVIFVSLPGVPFEMKSLMEDEVIPRLKKIFKTPAIIHKTILTQGVGESFLSDQIEEWELQLPENIRLAYLPQPGVVRLRLSGTGVDEKSLAGQIDDEVEKLKKLIGPYIYGEDEDTLEEIIGKLLREKNETLSTAESCTGGYIGHLITSVPGSSDYFTGGIISYSNKVKEEELGVHPETIAEFGAVSKQVVLEMAEGARTKLQTDYSIAVSGVAGPGGGTEEKPVGLTWIAVSSSSGTVAYRYNLGENRERNIRKAALEGLNLLRKKILEDRKKA